MLQLLCFLHLEYTEDVCLTDIFLLVLVSVDQDHGSKVFFAMCFSIAMPGDWCPPLMQLICLTSTKCHAGQFISIKAQAVTFLLLMCESPYQRSHLIVGRSTRIVSLGYSRFQATAMSICALTMKSKKPFGLEPSVLQHVQFPGKDPNQKVQYSTAVTLDEYIIVIYLSTCHQ